MVGLTSRRRYGHMLSLGGVSGTPSGTLGHANFLQPDLLRLVGHGQEIPESQRMKYNRFRIGRLVTLGNGCLVDSAVAVAIVGKSADGLKG
jgi:hypothetical protein